MQDNQDTQSAARILLKRFGRTAPREAAQRALELMGAGDREAAALWLDVEKAVTVLLEAQNPGPAKE